MYRPGGPGTATPMGEVGEGDAPYRRSGKPLAGFADQRDSLGEEQADGVAHLHRLLVRAAAQLEPADGGDRHAHRQVDRLVGERHLLLLLSLFHEPGQLTLDLLRITAEHAERKLAHSGDDTA